MIDASIRLTPQVALCALVHRQTDLSALVISLEFILLRFYRCIKSANMTGDTHHREVRMGNVSRGNGHTQSSSGAMGEDLEGEATLNSTYLYLGWACCSLLGGRRCRQGGLAKTSPREFVPLIGTLSPTFATSYYLRRPTAASRRSVSARETPEVLLKLVSLCLLKKHDHNHSVASLGAAGMQS